MYHPSDVKGKQAADIITFCAMSDGITKVKQIVYFRRNLTDFDKLFFKN